MKCEEGIYEKLEKDWNDSDYHKIPNITKLGFSCLIERCNKCIDDNCQCNCHDSK